MEIKKLETLKFNPTTSWGLNGYTTNKIFEVTISEDSAACEFKLKEACAHYAKIWQTGPGDIERLNEIIEKGHSFGAFKNGELLGWIICELRNWNRSFYVENILVDEKFRGQKIGEGLIKQAIDEAKKLNCRIVELETQNTNYSAVRFYSKSGFNITGLNTKLYSDSKEIALFMTFDLENHHSGMQILNN